MDRGWGLQYGILAHLYREGKKNKNYDGGPTRFLKKIALAFLKVVVHKTHIECLVKLA